MAAMTTALVTGANRGIGREVCRQLVAEGTDVVLTGRDPQRVADAANELGCRGEVLDLTDPMAPDALADRLRSDGVHVDVLVNNAIAYDSSTVLGVDDETLDVAMSTNLVGPWRVIRAFVPAMVERGFGRVVNVSSGWGSFAEGLGGPATYSVTKAALNALTVKTSREVRGDVTVNSMCPDWVDSAGTGGGGRSVAEGADTIVWLATHPAGGPNGGFFRDRRPIEW